MRLSAYVRSRVRGIVIAWTHCMSLAIPVRGFTDIRILLGVRCARCSNDMIRCMLLVSDNDNFGHELARLIPMTSHSLLLTRTH